MQHLIFFQVELLSLLTSSSFGTIPVPNNWLYKSSHYEPQVNGGFLCHGAMLIRLLSPRVVLPVQFN